ncbi:MAG: phosphate:Na+ symporter [Myxococcota bacterium]|jgi:phosphate:Na+ symporter
MGEFQVGLAVAVAVVLFLFGIEHFSAEIQAITGQRFRRSLAKSTNNRFTGFALGAVLTAVIQSSTATSVITVGLVNAGALTFRQSLGVLFGANVGTTVTAQLVAWKLTDFAPALILVGFVASLLPFRWRIFGKSIFYFGLVFFSLQLVSGAVEPLKSDPAVLAWLGTLDNPALAIAAGAVLTAMVQSSSVTTGVAIVLISQDALSLTAAIPLLIGANIGTTSTSLIAAARLDTSAKRTAVSHAMYNIIGAVLFFPLLGVLGDVLEASSLSGASALAMAHLVFNLVTAMLFLALLEPFGRLVEWLVPDDAGEGEPIEALEAAAFATADHGAATVRSWAGQVVRTQHRGYIAAVLAIETRDSSIDNRARKVESMVQYALEEASVVVRHVARGPGSAERSEAVLRYVITIDHLRQIQDSLGDLLRISARLESQHARLTIDSLLQVQAVYPVFAKLLDLLGDVIARTEADALTDLQAVHDQAQAELQDAYASFIELARDHQENGELADFLSIHQRLRTKVAAMVTYTQGASAVPASLPASFLPFPKAEPSNGR